MLISHALSISHQNRKQLEAATFQRRCERLFCSIFYFDSGDPEDVCKSVHSGCLKGGTVLQPRYEDVWIQTVSVHVNYECVQIQDVSVDMKVPN